MARLTFGQRAPYLQFANDSEFFEAYGFLCNTSKHHLEFQWEFNANSGAWGNEGRIHFLKANGNLAYTPIPNSLNNRLTAGRWGNPVYRLNCNDYIKELVGYYGFTVNPMKPGNIITRTAQGLIPPANPMNYVPRAYIADYNRGYNM